MSFTVSDVPDNESEFPVIDKHWDLTRISSTRILLCDLSTCLSGYQYQNLYYSQDRNYIGNW